MKRNLLHNLMNKFTLMNLYKDIFRSPFSPYYRIIINHLHVLFWLCLYIIGKHYLLFIINRNIKSCTILLMLNILSGFIQISFIVSFEYLNRKHINMYKIAISLAWL